MEKQFYSLGKFYSKLENQNNIPEKIDSQYANHFVRGFFDQVANIWLNYKSGCSTTFAFTCIYNFYKFINNLIKPIISFSIREQKDSIRLITSGNKQIKKLMDWLYNNATIFDENKKNQYYHLIKLINEKSRDKVLEGMIFNRLTTIKKIEEKGGSKWLCRCICGKEKIIKSEFLLNGDTKSCGCLKSEISSKNYKKAIAKIKKYHSEDIAILASLNKNTYSDSKFGDLFLLTKMNCFYCNSNCNTTISYSNDRNIKLLYTGLDRIDSNLGHERTNVVPCCFKCNVAKRERSLNDFLDWTDKIYANIDKIKTLIK